MSKTVTVKLSTPVSHNDTVYSELTFRKPKTGDLCMADLVTGETTKTLAILARMADVSLPVMQDIDLDDFARISEEVAPLMGEFPKAADGLTS